MIDQKTAAETDRRAFLKSAGKYAVVVPPAMTLLLSTTLTSDAVAQSASVQSACNRGPGNGPEGCDPGNSGGKPGNAGEGHELGSLERGDDRESGIFSFGGR